MNIRQRLARLERALITQTAEAGPSAKEELLERLQRMHERMIATGEIPPDAPSVENMSPDEILADPEAVRIASRISAYLANLHAAEQERL